jgi:hypothetical protein
MVIPESVVAYPESSVFGGWLDAESSSTTVRDKLSEIAVIFIDFRLGACLVKGDLISASTDKRAEESIKNCSCVFQVPPVHGRQGLRIGSSFFG